MASHQSHLQESAARRSTRIATDILIEVKGEGFAYAAETITVNLHGALIRTSARLEIGTVLNVYVHRTRKTALARIVFADREDPSQHGIELERPENIWGVAGPPSDWELISP